MRHKQKGFTIIELMVTISIMVILLTVVIANFGTGNQKRNLTIGRNVMMSDIRKAQSLSISSKDISPSHPASSYSITMNKSSNNRSYSLVGKDNSIPANQSTIISPTLPTNTYIKTITINKQDGGTIVISNTLNVEFLVPYGRIAMSYDNSNGKELNDIATITLSTADNTKTLDIVVNGVVGTIYTQ